MNLRKRISGNFIISIVKFCCEGICKWETLTYIFQFSKHCSCETLLNLMTIKFLPIPGRVITSGTRQSLPQAMTGRKLQRTVWWPTKLLVTSQIRHCHSHTPFALALPSTSQSSTMRSSTPLIVPAGYHLCNTSLHL